MSSIRHAPISGQHEVWAQMSEMLDKAHMKLPQHSQDPPFHYKPSVFLICGDNDPIIIKDELKKDATAVLGGPEKLTFRTLDAGHDFPITEGTQVAEMIIEFWQSPGYSPDSAEP